jgi:hypothetical protein
VSALRDRHHAAGANAVPVLRSGTDAGRQLMTPTRSNPPTHWRCLHGRAASQCARRRIEAATAPVSASDGTAKSTSGYLVSEDPPAAHYSTAVPNPSYPASATLVWAPLPRSPRKQNPIKTPAAQRGLAHRAVYSISRRRGSSPFREVFCAAKLSKPSQSLENGTIHPIDNSRFVDWRARPPK